jgi:RNA polymerase sigma-70 factor (ECF subfamily)
MGDQDKESTRTTVDDIWREHRPYLVDLAFRMVGSIHEAEDIVQEAFSRLLAADIDEIEETRGWLIVVVSRLCLDHLRSAKVRREASVGLVDDQLPAPSNPLGANPLGADPADRVTLDDSVRLALLVVLEQLSPPERAVFVLHDVFRLSFEATADIVGRSPAACRQLASRARRRIESETGPGRFSPAVEEQHEVAAHFIAACAGGDLESLMRLLDPEVVGDYDLGPEGPPRRPIHGSVLASRQVLRFLGPATGTTLVSQPINGRPGVLAFRERTLYGIFVFKVADGRIIDIHGIADPAKLAYVNTKLARH